MNNDSNQTAETSVTDDLDAFSNELFGQEVQVSQEGQTTDESTEQEPDEGEPDEVQEVVAEVEEGSEEEADPEAEEEYTEEVEQPKKKTVQDRINELVREREEAKREGDRKLEELRKEFEAKLAGLNPKEEAQPAAAGEPTPDDLNEDGTPKYDLGEFDPKYIRDLTKYTLEQERARIEQERSRETEQAEQTKAQQEMVQKWNEKVESAVTQYPDFMEKGQALVNSFGGLEESYGMYLTNLLMSMDKGPEVLYYLSNHPEEATQIVNSGAQRATLTLGRIEAKFLETTQQEAPKIKVSQAPAPAPAQARARGSNGAFVSVSPDTDDLTAFESEFFVKKK